MGKMYQYLDSGENFSLPYGYLAPAQNFVKNSNGEFGEAELIRSFNEEAFPVDTQRVTTEIQRLITIFQEKEKRFLQALKDNGTIASEPDGQGFFQLRLGEISKTSEEVKRLSKLLTGALDLPVYRSDWYTDAFVEYVKKMAHEYFIGNLAPNNALWAINVTEKTPITSGATALSYFKPEVLNDIKNKVKVNIEVEKAVANLIAWYDTPKNAAAKEQERTTYDMLKAYAQEYKIRKASETINYEHTNMYELLAKMVESAIGKIKAELGSLTEKELAEKLLETLPEGFDVKSTGNKRGKVTLRAESDKFLYNSELYEEENWQKKLHKALRTGASAARNPKADITVTDKNSLEQWGLSVKHQQLYTENIKSTAKIQLHKGTYLSLIRYLMRYKEGIPLAEELMRPEIMHTVLNLTRGQINSEVESPALDKAVSALGYVFIGMGDETAFLTDYGIDVFAGTAGSNSIVALVDSAGQGRLMSYYLKDIQANIEQAQLMVKFKLPTELGHMINKEHYTVNPYHTYRYAPSNQAETSDFSAITAQIYIKTFHKQ